LTELLGRYQSPRAIALFPIAHEACHSAPLRRRQWSNSHPCRARSCCDILRACPEPRRTWSSVVRASAEFSFEGFGDGDAAMASAISGTECRMLPIVSLLRSIPSPRFLPSRSTGVGRLGRLRRSTEPSPNGKSESLSTAVHASRNGPRISSLSCAWPILALIFRIFVPNCGAPTDRSVDGSGKPWYVSTISMGLVCNPSLAPWHNSFAISRSPFRPKQFSKTSRDHLSEDSINCSTTAPCHDRRMSAKSGSDSRLAMSSASPAYSTGLPRSAAARTAKTLQRPPAAHAPTGCFGFADRLGR